MKQIMTKTPTVKQTVFAPQQCGLKETAEIYVKRLFPLGQKEYLAKYCSVGLNRFRINFFEKVTPNEIMSDSIISRSYYVVLTDTDSGWTHKILEG
jgi:hypothetical protein